MTTKTTHTPWTVKGVHVGPSKHFRAYTIEPNICEMNSSLAPDEVSANAAHIVRCVNEREELLDLVRQAYGRWTDNDMVPPNHLLQVWLARAEALLLADVRAESEG